MGACGSAPDRAERVTTVRDSAGIEIVLNHPGASTDSCALATEPSVQIGTVRGAPAYQLFRASDGVVLSDGRIAIVNGGSSEIRIYDNNGRYLNAFGREGDGPGEFSNVFKIWRIAGDTLVVGDWDPWRALYFLPDGTYLGTATPRPLQQNVPWIQAVLGDGTFILGKECCLNAAPGFTARKLHLMHYARNGAVMDTIGVYPNGRVGPIGPPELHYFDYRLFESHADASAGGRRIVIGHGSKRELPVRAPAGRIERIIRWTGPDRAVRQEDLDAFEKRIRALAAEIESPVGRQVMLGRIAEDHPVLDRFPAFADLILDRSGKLWVRRFEMGERTFNFETGSKSWLVFDSDGAFHCHARTPAGFRVFDIGADYVLGMIRDELDVQYVQLFSLRGLEDAAG